MISREVVEELLTLEERKSCFKLVIENEALFLKEIDEPELRDAFYKVQDRVKGKFGLYSYLDFRIDLMDSLAREFVKGENKSCVK